jgi:hypothetical protein
VDEKRLKTICLLVLETLEAFLKRYVRNSFRRHAILRGAPLPEDVVLPRGRAKNEEQ